MATTEKALKNEIIRKMQQLPVKDIKELKDYVVFLELKNLLPQIDSSQAYFWSKKWQKIEKTAETGIRHGKFSPTFSSVKDLLKHLKK